MSTLLKWTEISSQPENKRFEMLSAELTASGLANEFIPSVIPFEFLDEGPFDKEDQCDKFRDFVHNLKKNFDQVRVGGFFQQKISLLSHEYPAELFQIQVADALVHDQSKWWPRNFLFRAIHHLLLKEVKQIDLSNPVLIIGTGGESKTFISALIKLGFTRFNITGRDFSKCKILVEEMKRNYFSTRFECTEMNYLTQLPNIYSIGINTLYISPEEDLINSLIYFNFLAAG